MNELFPAKLQTKLQLNKFYGLKKTVIRNRTMCDVLMTGWFEQVFCLQGIVLEGVEYR